MFGLSELVNRGMKSKKYSSLPMKHKTLTMVCLRAGNNFFNSV
jgi:hypothetical protein